jgi:hypothetical protein
VLISGGQGSDGLSQGHFLLLNQCIKKVKETVAKLSTEHKDLHASVSKVGKAIDKSFMPDFNGVFVEGAFEGEDFTREINQVICDHILRQGLLDIAESLVQDSGLELDIYQKEPFLQIHHISEALKVHNLQPALQWAESNRERLMAQNSSLEFKLHRLQFIELLQHGLDSQWEAIQYSRNFSPFAFRFTKDIQVLMGSLLYMKQGIENSPYAFLLEPVGWEEIADIFTRDACTLLGLSVDSPLSTEIKAGCQALPPLLTLKQVMQQRQCSSVWSAKDELPVEIDLSRDCRFHSVFACPILRQQSSDNNPPVRLICGHVISRDALNKLTNANKVKCPYCPQEQSPADARQIFF